MGSRSLEVGSPKRQKGGQGNYQEGKARQNRKRWDPKKGKDAFHGDKSQNLQGKKKSLELYKMDRARSHTRKNMSVNGGKKRGKVPRNGWLFLTNARRDEARLGTIRTYRKGSTMGKRGSTKGIKWEGGTTTGKLRWRLTQREVACNWSHPGVRNWSVSPNHLRK